MADRSHNSATEQPSSGNRWRARHLGDRHGTLKAAVPGMKADMKEVTNMLSPYYKEFIAGLREGRFHLRGNYSAQGCRELKLQSDLNLDAEEVQVILPGALAPGPSRASWRRSIQRIRWMIAQPIRTKSRSPASQRWRKFCGLPSWKRRARPALVKIRGVHNER